MCEMKDRELPHYYICALCGEGQTEEERQGISICPDCDKKMDAFMGITSWEKE